MPEKPKKEEKIFTGRKQWKALAKSVVRKHYLLLLLLCLLSMFYGTEFGYIPDRTEHIYDLLSGNTTLEEAMLGPNTVEEDPEGDEGPRDSALKQYLDETVTQHDNGIFASIANSFSSGKVQEIIYNGIKSILRSDTVSNAILIVFSLGLSLAFSIFVRRLYVSMMRRMFLEARTYETVPVTHIFYFKYVGRWIRASLTLLVKDVLKALWALTVVGAVIKRYSYFLVPYIVAENPDVKPLEAVTLSRRMMDGHKWEACKLELSFIGWDILGVVTFGLFDMFWTVPYSVATYCEYYAARREEAKANDIEGAERLNDTYLFERAPQAALDAAYGDVIVQETDIDRKAVELPPRRKFLAENFGLWIGNRAEKDAYDAVEGRRRSLEQDAAIVRGEIYPLRLSPIWKESGTRAERSLSYLRTYTVVSVVMIFFAFSLLGWLWEVGIHLVNDGVFVNRGCMHGPWLPIYGGGVAMIIVLLARWRSKKYAEAVAIVVLCGIVEYMTSFILELTKGMRWWDYTGYFLNLNGRICGEGLMVFALGGMAAVYLLAPMIDSMLSRINVKKLTAIAVILLLCFGADLVYSHFVPNVGEGITDYNYNLFEAQ